MYEPPKMREARKEGQSWLKSFLSTYSERHAAIIGFGVALALGVHGLGIIVAVSLGIAGTDQMKNRKAIREMRKEPWYSIGSSVIGLALNVFFGIGTAGIPV